MLDRVMGSGKIEEIVIARFHPGEDILEAIYEICKEKNIRTGVIMDGSGAGENFTYQHFPHNKAFMIPGHNVVIATMEGKCEMSLQGTIGTTVVKAPEGMTDDEYIDCIYPTIPGYVETIEQKWHYMGSAGGNGTPYVHAHCTATNKDTTVCGHLMPGTRCGSGNPDLPSHFSVVIAKISGVELQATLDDHRFFYQNIVEVKE